MQGELRFKVLIPDLKKAFIINVYSKERYKEAFYKFRMV